MQFSRTTKWLIGILAFLLAGILISMLMGCGDEGDDRIESALYPQSHVAAAVTVLRGLGAELDTPCVAHHVQVR